MNNQSIIDNIKNLYDNGDIQEIIKKTVWLFKASLQLRYSTGELYTRTHDLGIKPNEMGISLAIALNQTDTSVLHLKDIAIKEKLLTEMSKEIKTWEKGI